MDTINGWLHSCNYLQWLTSIALKASTFFCMRRATQGTMGLKAKFNTVDYLAMRDEFTEKTKRVIQDRAGNRCSNPECRVLTSGPNAHPERSTKTGVAAHITAASPGGPRPNSNLTPEQRQSAENGIWLCQNCAHFVDADDQNYSVKLLCEWKSQAEKEADDETKGRKGRLPLPHLAEFEEEQE